MLLSMLTLSKNGKQQGPVKAKFGQFWSVFDLFWSQSPLVDSTWALRWLLACLKSSARFLSNIFGLYTAFVSPHIVHIHAKIVAIYTPKVPKMNAKLESLLFFSQFKSFGCLFQLYLFNHLSDPNQLFLGIRWRWYLCTLSTHSCQNFCNLYPKNAKNGHKTIDFVCPWMAAWQDLCYGRRYQTSRWRSGLARRFLWDVVCSRSAFVLSRA